MADVLNNSIYTIEPYKTLHGQWVFDDPGRGLFREAFVAGVDTMLDDITHDNPWAWGGFNLLFSAIQFPGYTHLLTKKDEESGGAWYFGDINGNEMTGWLCPALLTYFEEIPEEIFIQIDDRLAVQQVPETLPGRETA